jgi:hypothetical protein
MNIDQFLAAGYGWRYRLEGIAENPAPAMAAAGIPRADIEARRGQLAAVELRCSVSRVHREFLDEVLALLG